MVLSGFSKHGRSVSRAALGLALAMGVVAGSTVASSPAMAAKKKKSKAPKLKFSKGFVAVAGPVQKAVNALDGTDAAASAEARNLLEQAYGAIEVEDDRFLAGSLAVSLGGKLKDPALQRRGIKSMLQSGKSDPASAPRFNSIAGQLAYQAKDYADARHYLQIAVDSGYTADNTEMLLAESYISDNQATKGLAIVKSALTNAKASGTVAPESWYRRGLASAFKAQSLNDAADIGSMLITDYPDPKNVGVAATILRVLGGYGSQETLDVMRLMARTNSYVETRDYVEYIQAADPRRLPGEVMEAINSGLASGMLSASDPFVADAKQQASGRLAGDKASLPGYERDARKASASEATVSGAADALLSYGEAAKAESLYQIALARPGVNTQRALTRLGIAQVDLGKYDAALQTFAKVTGKRASIAKLWSAFATSKAAAAAAPAEPEAAPAS